MESCKRSLQLTACSLQLKALGVVLLFGIGALALAQNPGVAKIAAPVGVQAQAHSIATADFKIAVQPGFHIQSNHPKLDYLIPSRISLTAADGVSVAKVNWPEAKAHTFSFAPGQPLNVFEGTFTVPVILKTGAAGNALLHGTFRYQACNDQLCKPPVTVPFTLAVHVH